MTAIYAGHKTGRRNPAVPQAEHEEEGRQDLENSGKAHGMPP